MIKILFYILKKSLFLHTFYKAKYVGVYFCFFLIKKNKNKLKTEIKR